MLPSLLEGLVTKSVVGLCIQPKNLWLESQAQWALVVYCWICVIVLFLFFLNVDEWLWYNISTLFHFFFSFFVAAVLLASLRKDSRRLWVNLSLFSGSHGSVLRLMRNCKTPRKSCPTKTPCKTISCFFLLAGEFLSYAATHEQL